jgi:hypothetical protein
VEAGRAAAVLKSFPSLPSAPKADSICVTDVLPDR